MVFIKALAHGEIEVTTSGNNHQAQRTLYVFGIPVGMRAQITIHGKTQTTTVNSEGVLAVSLQTGVSQIAVKW